MSLLDELYGRRTIQILDWASVGLMGACFWIGQVQASQSSSGFLTNYGADLVGPVTLLWPLRRTLFQDQRRGSAIAAAVVLVGCFLWEFSQLRDGGALGVTAGTFDPWDLAAYTASVAAGLFADAIARRRRA